MVEQTTFNRLAEGSIPSALTIIHNPSPISHSFPACLLLVVISDLRLLYRHDLQVQDTLFPFYIMMTVLKKAAISYSLLRS